MNEANSTETCDALIDLGFQPNDPGDWPGLSYDFSNFKLNAGSVVNMRFAEIVLFTGVLSTPRTLAEVEFEMPRRVESLEQCAAWIVWHLDSVSEAGTFVPKRKVDWVSEGRQNQRVLPWVAARAAYEARPWCYVERDWLRLALKTLRDILQPLDDEALVQFSFRDAILTIRCGGKVVVLPAEGNPWPKQYVILAKEIRDLRRRLMRASVDISVWEEHLHIGGWGRFGVVEERPA